MFDDDIFYPVPGYEENVEVRKDGVFRSPLTGRELKPYYYKRNDAWIVGTGRKLKAIRAYALVFIPNPGNLRLVHTKDGDESKIDPDMIYWSDVPHHYDTIGEGFPTRLTPQELEIKRAASVK